MKLLERANLAEINIAFLRVLEICALGKHTLSIVYSKYAPQRITGLEISAFIHNACQGNSNLYPSAPYSSNPFDADIIFEYTPVRFDSLIRAIRNTKENEWITVGESIKNAGSILPFEETKKQFLKLKGGTDFLNNMYYRCELGISDIDSIISVSATCAALSNETYQMHHLAEAMQYKSFDRSKINDYHTYYLAEIAF